MNKNKIKYIAFDADDTLWVNETLFRINEKKFSDLLSQYLEGVDFIDELYQKEMENLHHFGYGIKGFVLSMIETAIELTNSKIHSDDLMKIIEWGKEQLKHPVELIEGVEDALKSLAENYTLLLITKGDLFDQESKIARSGLDKYFTHIEIVSDKNDEVYSKILNKYKIDKPSFVMIGNSVKSDILPLLNIGSNAIFIPFHTSWIHEQVEDIDKNYSYLEFENLNKLKDYFIKE